MHAIAQTATCATSTALCTSLGLSGLQAPPEVNGSLEHTRNAEARPLDSQIFASDT